jgi:hypothetical protein
MQGEHRHLLVFPPIRSDVTAFAKEDKIISAVPILDDIKPPLNLAAQLAEAEIAAQEDRPARFAEFQERRIGGMLDVVARKAPQNGVGVRRAQP